MNQRIATNNNNDLQQHVTITNNKLSEVDVDEEEYETGDDDEDEEEDGGYDFPYKLKNINLHRSESVENNHFVEHEDQNYNNDPNNNYNNNLNIHNHNINQSSNNNQHYNTSNNKGGNFYEYDFDGDELVEGDAGTTCLYNQVTSASYRRESHQPHVQQATSEQRIDQQQQPPSSSSSPPSSTTSPSKKQKAMIATSSLHVTTAPPTKLGSIKSWSTDTFEYAKQYVFERLGKSQKTSDSELEKKIAELKEIQKEFKVLHDLSRLLYQQYYTTINTQKLLSGVLLDLSHKALDEGLCGQFNCSSISQKAVYKNGLKLLRHMGTFVKSMDTICNTTIEDSLATAKMLESARLKFDAYRSCLERVRNSHRDSHYTLRVQEAERNFNKHQSKYLRLHHDLNIKLKFLEDNRIKVFRKHLYLFQRGFHENVNHNKESLDAIMSQFSVDTTTHHENHHFLETPPQNSGCGSGGGDGGDHITNVSDQPVSESTHNDDTPNHVHNNNNKDNN